MGRFAPLGDTDAAAQAAFEVEYVAWREAKRLAQEAGQQVPTGPLNVEQRDAGSRVIRAAEYRARRLKAGATAAQIELEMESRGLEQTLLMYGPGGTGKSATIYSIVAAAAELGVGEVVITAYTGVAAAPFAGPMLLSLFNSNPETKSSRNLKTLAPDQLEKLKDKFELEAGVEIDELAVLVIDEVSFVDGLLVGHMDNWLRQLTGNLDAYCGGIIVLFAGDNCQKPPPGGTPWYKDLIDAARGAPELRQQLARPDAALARGLKLLRRQKRVVLWRIMRAADDPLFAELQHGMRQVGADAPAAKLVNMLKPLLRDDVQRDEAWRFAIIGVLSHCERDHLNVAQMRAFAQAFDSPIFKWRLDWSEQYAGLLSGLAPATREALYKEEVALWGWWCEGFPILISETIRSTRKLVNGSPALLDSLEWAGGVPDQVTAAYATGGFCEREVPVPYCVNACVSGTKWHGVELDDISERVETLVPGEGGATVVPLMVGKKRVDADLYGIDAAKAGLPSSVEVHQHTYILAAALTDFKLQGRTLPKLLLSFGARVKMPYMDRMNKLYVLLSRATTLDGLRLLEADQEELKKIAKLQWEPHLEAWEAGYGNGCGGLWDEDAAAAAYDAVVARRKAASASKAATKKADDLAQQQPSMALRHSELQELCKARGLDAVGQKKVLLQRLLDKAAGLERPPKQQQQPKQQPPPSPLHKHSPPHKHGTERQEQHLSQQ